MIPYFVWDYLKKIDSISEYTHSLIFKDVKQSWSSRAYWKKDENIIAYIAVKIIGEQHCRECYQKWHERKK